MKKFDFGKRRTGAKIDADGAAAASCVIDGAAKKKRGFADVPFLVAFVVAVIIAMSLLTVFKSLESSNIVSDDGSVRTIRLSDDDTVYKIVENGGEENAYALADGEESADETSSDSLSEGLSPAGRSLSDITEIYVDENGNNCFRIL
jgi:hypothetical protein